MTITTTDIVYATMASPVGELLLTGDGKSLSGLYMSAHHGHTPAIGPGWSRDPDAFGRPIEQLNEYFAGARQSFDLELSPRGTEFQMTVWSALRTIGYGQTRSYGQLAAQVGRPRASRAVGLANGRNPISIIVPCHRVIGADGSLTGYGGGLDNKKILLDLEAAQR
ncbi:MAG: methylated-DNA--[protein]-cysteine S-methyltransferase [Acidimicrobiales bacterium]